MAKTVIEMQHITKRFGAFTANDDISLTLQQGEILALLGENGAGKSTLMGVLTGQLKPTAGAITGERTSSDLKWPSTCKSPRDWDGTPTFHVNSGFYGLRKHYPG